MALFTERRRLYDLTLQLIVVIRLSRPWQRRLFTASIRAACPKHRQSHFKRSKLTAHRCQPSRNRAGNPAFWLIYRISAFLPERPACLTLFRKKQKSLKISVMLAVRRHLVRKSSAGRQCDSVT